MRLFVTVVLCLAGCGGDEGQGTPDASQETPDALRPPDLAPPPMVDPGPISRSATTLAETETTVVAAGDGRVVVAWIAYHKDGATTDIGYRVSPDRGLSWPDPPRLITALDGRVSTDPVLAAAPGGDVYLAWMGFRRDPMLGLVDWRIYVARAAAGSATFDPPVDASELSGMPYDKPWIAVLPDGTVLVSYQLGNDIVVARSGDGRTFTTHPIPPLPGYESFAHPCLPVGAGGVAIVEYGDTGQLWLRRSDDGGMTWSGVAMSGMPTDAMRRASVQDAWCALAGTDLWVAFGMPPASPMPAIPTAVGSIYVAHSGDGGLTFDRGVEVADPDTLMLLPSLVAASNGQLSLIYLAGPQAGDPTGELRRRTSTDGGRSFGAPTVLHRPLLFTGDRTRPTWFGDYLGLDAAPGHVFVSYVDNRPLASHVAFLRVPE